ncbi:MAG: hypothetical protein LBN30_05255 [Oscillospiraceae bacterium]|jgi:ABC-type sugar transport system substrate-binding protein|nr:hypothetical protein [Oscillospiraceae bacterium]
MRRIILGILVLVMCLSLFACKGADETPNASAEPTVSESPDETTAVPEPKPDKGLGYYDAEYDYTLQPRYTVAYITRHEGADFRGMLEIWAARFNCELDTFYAGSDAEVLTQTATLKAQGYAGFLFDAETAQYPAIAGRCKELDVAWFAIDKAPRGADGKLLHPWVTPDYAGLGADTAEYLMLHWNDTYLPSLPENTEVKNVGIIALGAQDDADFTAVSRGIADKLESYNEPTSSVWLPATLFNIDSADGSASGNAEQTIAKLNALLAENPDIDAWFVVAANDSLAQGVSNFYPVAESGVVAVVTIGGASQFRLWDADDADEHHTAAAYTDGLLRMEPVFGGLYALMRGETTAEELWSPKWVNGGAGETYASLQVPSAVIDRTNYREYLEWVDLYTRVDRVQYNVFVVPEQYPSRENPDFR